MHEFTDPNENKRIMNTINLSRDYANNNVKKGTLYIKS